MPGKITKKFRLHTARQFQEQFSEAVASNLYFFIAKNTAWPDEAIPPTPSDTTTETVYKIWDNMLALKKISPADVSFAIPRIDWKTGTIYSQYTSETEFWTNNDFFVVTDEYHVYKCIYNNGGVVSTQKPTGTLTTEITLADGYIWKYMLTINASDALKFTTASFIPVKTIPSNDGSTQWLTQAAAVSGAISSVLKTSGGSGYIENASTVAVGGAGTTQLDSSASNTTGIYVGMNFYVSSGTGAGQIRTISAYNGTTKVATFSVNLATATDPTSTYVISPAVTITGDGTGALAYCRITSTQVSKVYVINKGSGYTRTTTTVTGGLGSGAVVSAQISPEGGHGKDAVKELFGHNVIMNVKMTGSEANTFPILNDFRTVGIIVDPIEAGGSVVANNIAYRQTTKLNLSSISGTFTTDETITGGISGAVGKMVEYASNTSLLVTENVKLYNVAETITGGTSGATANVASKVEPGLTKYKGELLYIEHRSPISRAFDQQEDIKIIILM